MFVQAVRDAGIRAVKQKLCRSPADVLEFTNELSAVGSSGGFKCVVKPNESAGTDSVFLCKSPTEVRWCSLFPSHTHSDFLSLSHNLSPSLSLTLQVLDAFTQIHGHANGLGHENDGALCQEFLTGTEYVIDGVSRDGVYKVSE